MIPYIVMSTARGCFGYPIPVYSDSYSHSDENLYAAYQNYDPTPSQNHKTKFPKKPQKSFQNLNHYLRNFNKISVPNLETPHFFLLQNNYSQTYTHIKKSFIFFRMHVPLLHRLKNQTAIISSLCSAQHKKKDCAKGRKKMFLRISWRLAIVEFFFKHKKIFCLLFNELFLPSPRMLIN